MSVASTGVSSWEKQPGRAAYSVAETAQMLGLCEASIYRAMRRGDIASVLVGGRRIIPVTAIDRLLSNGGDRPHD